MYRYRYFLAIVSSLTNLGTGAGAPAVIKLCIKCKRINFLRHFLLKIPHLVFSHLLIKLEQ